MAAGMFPSFQSICIVLIVGTYGVIGQLPNFYKPLFEAQRGVMLEPEGEKTSNSCLASFEELLHEPSKLVQVLDSYGKPEAGFFVGNWAWYGHFDECTNIADFHYCLMYLNFNISSLHIPQLSELELQWGICVPDECSEEDMTHHSSTLFEQMLADEVLSRSGGNGVMPGIGTGKAKCVQKPITPIDGWFVFTMVLFCLIGLLMVGGALLDVYDKWQQSRYPSLSVQADEDTQALVNQHHEANGNVQNVSQFDQFETVSQRVLRIMKRGFTLVLRDFSFSRNLALCLNTDVVKGQIQCINGIRVISMFWVILGHTYFFPQTYGGIQNYAKVEYWFDHIPFQTIMNGVFSVDTFFVLSGLLTCYLTLLKMNKKNGKIPWGMYYFHRFYRLTPVMLVSILVWMYMVPYMFWGPKAKLLAERPYCPDYWWANVLYIQNFYPPRFGQACLGWTWYLANDMQFFVITPVILVALFRIPWLGIVSIFSLLGVSFASSAALTYHFNFSSTPVAATDTINGPDYGNIMYQKPYVRIPPYLAGMLLGYLMYRLKDRPQIKIHPAFVALGWVLAWVVGLLVIYGLYPDFTGNPLSTAGNMFYQMFARFAWGLCICWVIFACHYGYGGYANTILSWKFWIPLSRLTYSAYLLHPMVITVFLGNMGQSYYLSITLQSFYFCAFLVLSYASALLMMLAIELPVANLETHIMSRRS